MDKKTLQDRFGNWCRYEFADADSLDDAIDAIAYALAMDRNLRRDFFQYVTKIRDEVRELRNS